MSMRCPRCGREFDVTLFEFGRRITCPCGAELTADEGHMIRSDPAMDSLEREIFGAVEAGEDRREAERIGREADRIASAILHGDMPRVDIEIAIRRFRSRVLGLFPDKGELFDALYTARFKRMWTQFRPGEDPILED